jgi:multiple sugar transport system permease protein/putative aldouronate transport system permease protein
MVRISQAPKGAARGRIKATGRDRAFNAAVMAILAFALAVTAFPLIHVLSASFSSPYATTTGRVWLLPVEPTLKGYQAVFENASILRGYGNSIIYTIAGTAINLAVTVMAAYPLSRKDFRSRNKLMLLFAFTMFFSGGMVPSYILMVQLRLINTRWAMLIPGALSVYNLIVMRTFFQNSIPGELLEAAKIDGCSDFRYLFSMLLPLSKAILAVIGLFYGIGHWNSYFSAMLYLNDVKLQPLQMVLRDILVLNTLDLTMVTNINFENMIAKEGVQELLKYAVIVVSCIPVMIAYPFVQRFFVKGVMIGSIKG